MFLYWLFFILIFFCATKNWKNTVIVWMPLQLLFNDCICLKYNSPAVSLTLGVNALLLVGYYLWGNRQKNLDRSRFVFKDIFILYLFSFMLSMMFSIVSISVVLTNTMKTFINGFIILMLFYKALHNMKDIMLFFKVSSYVVLLIVGLGLYETIMVDNPVLDYVYVNAPFESIYGKMYYVPPFAGSGDLQRRYGLVRAYSFSLFTFLSGVLVLCFIFYLCI